MASRSGSPFRRLALAPLALALVSADIAGQGTAQSQFRSGVTVVSVPVRVLNSAGDPVTDLRPADFELFESGVRQEVVQFSTRAAYGGVSVAPRTFAVILGFGNHERLLAERRQRLDITPTEKLLWNTTFDITDKPDQVKAVVYEYESDRLGTASLRIR
jgi:hypothetical protein